MQERDGRPEYTTQLYVEDGGKSASDWTDVLYKEINRKKIPDVKTSLGEGISTDSTVKAIYFLIIVFAIAQREVQYLLVLISLHCRSKMEQVKLSQI